MDEEQYNYPTLAKEKAEKFFEYVKNCRNVEGYHCTLRIGSVQIHGVQGANRTQTFMSAENLVPNIHLV